LFLSLIQATSSYAYWHEHEHGHGYIGINLGVWPGSYDYDYYYHPYYPYYAAPYYYPAYAVTSSTYQPVVFNGVTYYLNNGVYYIYTEYGYQAVATPVGAQVVSPAAVTPSPVSAYTDDSITINVPNDKGGYTAVVLKKSGNGYTGPQGEYYPEFPKVSQLKMMYGK